MDYFNANNTAPSNTVATLYQVCPSTYIMSKYYYLGKIGGDIFAISN